jgi:hypothetical protein
MQINKIKAAAKIAKGKTNDKRWINAIDKAVAGVESGWWIITELAHGVAVTTECGHTYFANGVCQCKAFENGQPCKHRALARLIEIASELKEEAAPEPARQPRIVRSVEQNYSHRFVEVVRCDGWMI